MRTYNSLLKPGLMMLVAASALFCGCSTDALKPANKMTAAMRDVPAVRLNYKYEAEVPGPSSDTAKLADERNAAVQADFDATRPHELLDRTLASPDNRHILAVYHRVTDTPAEYRLDMYSPDGKVLRKMTSDQMAVHFPETIRWSPDSNSVAFVAMIRTAQPNAEIIPAPSPADGEEAITASPAEPTPPAPVGILAFRSEQLYICAADGSSVKPVTQNEGLIYFYYAWSPDSTMLVALATTTREWRYFEAVAAGKGELLVPHGRPRIIEKNGRERRLDDNQTSILPVWSPDSSKVAAAFDVEISDAQNLGKKRRDTQIRIYDAAGTNPTQAAIPLRNQLLISSAAYDRNLHRQESSDPLPENSEAPTPEQPAQLSTLPDESELVSYNPVIEIAWMSDDLLYFRTAYVRRMMRESDNVTSFARWHRLVLSAQAAATPKP